MCRQAIQLVCKSLPRFSLFYISLLKQMSQRHNACFLLFGQEPRLPVDDLLGHSAVWWPARLRDPASGRWCWACCALEGPYAGNHSFGHGLWPPFAASISRWLTSASDTDDEQCLVLTPRIPASVAVVVPPVQGHPPRAWTSPPVHQWLHLCLSLDALGVWQKKKTIESIRQQSCQQYRPWVMLSLNWIFDWYILMAEFHDCYVPVWRCYDVISLVFIVLVAVSRKT